MTEFVEGPVAELKNWLNGQGIDVFIGANSEKYFYRGKVNIPLGITMRFEICDGDGDRKGQYEILNFTPLQANPDLGVRIPQPPPGMEKKAFVQIPFEQFQSVMSTRSALQETKTRSLDAASRIYAAMSKVEKDPKAAAHDVVAIAQILEGYLV